MDITTQMAFAAGLLALKDAGIPLVAKYKTTTTGKKALDGWALPKEMRERTGVIFASAFRRYSNLIKHLKKEDSSSSFDRRFLFQILSMGHSQFAQFIMAQGPNTQVNAACASTTQAISIAQDWIDNNRADRVIVIGADDVTNDELLEWIGSGFLAAGAATTQDDVKEAALPFDERRHGMILGMGAVGMVLEKEQVALGARSQTNCNPERFSHRKFCLSWLKALTQTHSHLHENIHARHIKGTRYTTSKNCSVLYFCKS